MKKRILISIVAIALCFVICLVTTASTPISTVTAFIDEELKAVMENAAADELIPVDIWITEVDTNEVETEVMKAIGDTKVSLLSANATTAVTHAQVDVYIETEREIYAEMQAEKSQTFLNKYDNIFSSRSSIEEKLLFVSEYTPVIRAKLTKSEINKLSADIFVNAIYYSPELLIENESNVSIPLVRSDYVRNTLGCSGNGIKIGIIEANALPERTASYFTSTNIIYDPSVNNNTATALDLRHANQVAAIMVAKSTTVDGITYCGIVPNAILYATHCSNNINNLYRRVEWLLSQGVNVINMSAGADGTGYYTSYERWIDHIAINHSVHFVKSAGNTGGYITVPGLSYNAITVGALNDGNTISYNGDAICNFSSYIENAATEMSYKPDLVAPGEDIKTAVYISDILERSGTSFSAPHVTAIIAQLCQRHPSLKTKQDVVKAILTASIKHTEHSYTPNDTNYDKYGAGMVDARSAMHTADNSKYVSSNFAANSSNGSYKTYTHTVSESDTKLRVSLAWLNYVNITGSHTEGYDDDEYYMADLDLYVYGPNNLTAESKMVGNVEIVEIDDPPAGTYTIKVVQYENSSKKVYFGLAWW